MTDRSSDRAGCVAIDVSRSGHAPTTVGPEMQYDFRILIHEAELDNIAGWVLEHPTRETGGDLCGFWTNTRSPSVQFVLGPGPRARHEVAAFYQDADYLRAGLRQGRERHGLQQIGEWHSHHRLGLAEPSGGDANTVQQVFDRYPVDEFLLCIANIQSSGTSLRRWTGGDTHVGLGAFMFRRDQPGWQRGTWVVLPGASPVAEAMRSEGVLRSPSRAERVWTVPRSRLEDSLAPPTPLPSGWYTRPAGAELLKQFDIRCRAAFAGCAITLEDGALYYRLISHDCAWELLFPRRFPGDLVELVDAGDTSRHYVDCPGSGSLAAAAAALFRDVCAIVQPAGTAWHAAEILP